MADQPQEIVLHDQRPKLGVRRQPASQTIPMVPPLSTGPPPEPPPWTELPNPGQTAVTPSELLAAFPKEPTPMDPAPAPIAFPEPVKPTAPVAAVVAAPTTTTTEPISTAEPNMAELTWAEYSAWRMTKCQSPESRLPLFPPFDELDQAMHEAVGEWAELCELVTRQRFAVLTDPEQRAELLDELGDCFFTVSWILDALGAKVEGRKVNDPFSAMQTLERNRARMASLAEAKTVLHVPTQATIRQLAIMDAWEKDTTSLLLHGICEIGGISGMWKKIRWQYRDIPPQLGIDLAHGAIKTLECLCAILGTTSLACVLGNIEKLNRRFPQGWCPGGGSRP